MIECMQFPDTWEEFEQWYGFEDKKEIYTNGSRLIQSFRVKQWLDHPQIQSGRRESGRVIAVPVAESVNITTSRWSMMSADLSEHGTSALTAVRI